MVLQGQPKISMDVINHLEVLFSALICKVRQCLTTNGGAPI